MAVNTNSDLLAAVNIAIGKTLAGQAGTWDGKQLTMADLSTLYAIRTDLEGKVGTASGAPAIGRTHGRINRE